MTLFSSIQIQGNLISEDLLQQIAEGKAAGQQPVDFALDPGTRLSDEMEYAWSRVRLEWKRFSDKSKSLSPGDPYGTSLARKWMDDFLKALGFELEACRASLTGSNGQSYAISHVAINRGDMPVHLVGFVHPDAKADREVNTLDVRSSGGTSRMSPHATMQEYLNVTDHLYGLVSNGFQLRLLRDCGRLVKLTYIEFDLRRMLEGDQYADFTLLFRLLHYSRFAASMEANDKCALEQYYEQSIASGNRIRDGLSGAVKEALQALGKGFVSHPANEALRADLASGRLSHKDYYRQLLRLVYRLLFLLVTEERDLVYDSEDKSEATNRFRELYRRYYSLARLRRLSSHRYLYNEQFTDLWPALQATFRLFEEGGNGPRLGIQPLGGDLFSPEAMPYLAQATIANRLLLECLRNMNEFVDKESKTLVSINYRSLDVEELGSVYEGLLDLHPVVLPGPHAEAWSFTFHGGTDRKTTGSYYTRPDLVNELIKSALIPVIEDRLKEHAGSREAQSKALLRLKVCDPAAGSGHMLLAAARTIAWYLARVQSGEENPAPSLYRNCLRQVIQHCIYAVDYNPDAVELCKLAFWLEGHNSGKPLGFLDHKVRNGNSLVGVTDLNVLKDMIPDEAFNAVTNDDPTVCKALKKLNAQERKKKQLDLFSSVESKVSVDFKASLQDYEVLEAIEMDDLQAVRRAADHFLKARRTTYHEEMACHIWTAAFFRTYKDADDIANPTSERLYQYFFAPTQYAKMAGEAAALSIKHKFFHWPLEFPDVWAQGGFDVMLGNPPWEIIELKETEFFETRDPEIAKADNKSARENLIVGLKISNVALFNEYKEECHAYDAMRKFLKSSGRNELTANGRVNMYSVFAENFTSLINARGRAGFIVPTGIATDDGNKEFIESILLKNRIVSLFDFENREKIFPDVHSRYKFSLFTIAGEDIGKQGIKFAFFLKQVEHLHDKLRVFELTREDFVKLNPNTKTCPVFRTSVDAQITSKIYSAAPILIDENSHSNPWAVHFKQGTFNMSTDSGSFKTTEELLRDGFRRSGNLMRLDDECWRPLLEAKMIWNYNHRFGTYSGLRDRSIRQTPTPSDLEFKDPSFCIEPWYWVDEKTIPYTGRVPSFVEEVINKFKYSHEALHDAFRWWLAGSLMHHGEVERGIGISADFRAVESKSHSFFIENGLQRAVERFPLTKDEISKIESSASKQDLLDILELRRTRWFVGFRDVTDSTNERTCIFSIIPFAGVGHTMPLIFSAFPEKLVFLVANASSLVFDMVARQKVAGMHLTYSYLKQLPVIPPNAYNLEIRRFMLPRLFELIYTAWDLKPFVEDLWVSLSNDEQKLLRTQWLNNADSVGANEWLPPQWTFGFDDTQNNVNSFDMPPFKWDEDRRAVLKAELDAIYAKLYGLTEQELRYILDPQDVYGPDFPGETFRVLKEKEMRQYGEYRTKRLVLEAWGRMEKEKANEKEPEITEI